MEDTANAIEDILKEHLGDELLAITTEYAADDAMRYGTSISLPIPESRNYFFGEQIDLPEWAYPAILIIPVAEDHEAMTREFQVEWYIVDDSEYSERVNQRFGKAISNILEAHPDLDGNAHDGKIGAIPYSSGKIKSEGPFLRAGLVTILYYVESSMLSDM